MLKRYMLITLVTLLGLWVLGGCGGGSAMPVTDTGQLDNVIAVRSPSNGDGLYAYETVYMSDFHYYEANHLYSIYLNEDTNRAELTDLGAFPSNGTDPPGKYTFNAQIGTTADGTRVYCFDYWTGKIVYYDADVTSPTYGTFVDPGIYIKTATTVLHVGEVTFGAPYEGNDWGDLFVSTTDNHVYRVNPDTGAAEDMGTIAYDGGGTINISAGDLAFDNEENFYLLTVGSPPGKGIYLIEGWEGDGPWTLTGSQVRTIGDSAQYRGLAILDGGAGDWLGDNDTGGSGPPDYIVRFGANDSEDTSYPMYLDGSLFDHGAGGDMSVGVLLSCPPYETKLIAGQNIEVGTVTIIPFEGNLHVIYEITADGWCITETHTHVATDPSLIPQKNGNPIPGQFDYHKEFDFGDCVTKYTEVIPGQEGWCEEDYLYIAAHAVVRDCNCTGEEVLVNGSFETPEVTTSQKWDIFHPDQVDGWGFNWTDAVPGSYSTWTKPDPAHLEIWEGAVPAVTPVPDGDQNVELDTDWDGPTGGMSGEPGNIELYQTVSNLGDYTKLSFAWRPRPSYESSCKMEVYWGETLLGVYDQTNDAPNSWKVETFELDTSGVEEVVLMFKEVGGANSFGTLLDDVSVLTCHFETAWGDGEDFDGANWATYIEWEVCPCPDEE